MKSFYLCNVFFIVLDLRLTRLGLGGVLFLCLYFASRLSPLASHPSPLLLRTLGFAEVTKFSQI